MIAGVILVAVLALAFVNGANDNFKGVATLHGAGRLGYRPALALATLTTLAGSLSAVLLASGLARRFGGRGLVPDAVVDQPVFILAVAVGAAVTVLLATRFGFPVSTTHALTGGLLGAGLALAGVSAVSFAELGSSFLTPLLLSPILALVLAALLRPALRRVEACLPAEAACLCVTPALEAVAVTAAGARLRVQAQTSEMRVGLTASCERHGARPVLSVRAGTLVDAFHMASAGAVGFARGLNDAPKIAALLIGLSFVGPALGTSGLALAMAVGGLMAARRVAHTLAFGISGMNATEGLSANLVTAGLVIAASPLGLPVSTTHVSCGALFGIGATNGEARWKMVVAIAAAWAITLPLAAACSAVAALLLTAVNRG